MTNNKIGFRGIMALALPAILGLLLTVVGCSSNTDPGGGGDTVVISFLPKAQGQEIDLTQTLDLSVSAPDANTVIVSWLRKGIVMGSEETYTYVPSALGIDTLRVVVDADGVAKRNFWLINVVPAATTLPPAVPGVLAGPGPAPGDVSVTWTKVSSSTFPMDEYVVAVSFTGAITEENWEQAQELRRVTHRVVQVGYEENFTVADDGMIPGAEAWFAVRAVDELGQVSPIEANGYTMITTEWWMEGVVRGEFGDVLTAVIVASVEPEISTNTDFNGIYHLGPFRSIDRISLATSSNNAPISGWYDFQSSPLDSVTGKDYEIVLIKRHLLDAACPLYGGQFLTYLRFMSRTQDDSNDPDNTLQKSWDSYPLRVYLPPLVNGAGVDLAESGRFAMAFWDSVMGESYFEETANPAAAQVVFRYGPSADFFGLVSLLQPAGPEFVLGDVIPEQVEVFLNEDLAPAKLAREISLHEFGHVLGLLSHSGCSFSDHLMVDGAVGGLSNEHPIHPDEQRAVDAIRHLPQSVDMGGYSLGQ